MDNIEHLKAIHVDLLRRCYDFSPPFGWRGVVDTMLADIAMILRSGQVPAGVFSIRQVKEKFGGLRVYVAGLPREPQSLAATPNWVTDAEVGPDLAPLSRDWHFEGICNLQFDEHLDDTTMNRILGVIAASAYMSE